MSVSRRLGAVLRLSSGLLVILALAWIASAIATGPANHHLLNARAAHTATAQVDGSLLIAGGTGNRGVMRSLEFFDPVSGTSTAGPRLLEARSGHSAIALSDGRVLLTGGRSGDNALLASSEIYDASGASLNPGASLGHARANHTSTLLADGRVLIAGGDADGIAEIYDPATDRFADAGRLAVARSGHSAVRLGDGRVLLVGGSDTAGATAEIFDPKTNTSSAVRGGLKTARVQPTLKLISDGKVQVYGGDAEITMEVYNPAGYFSSRGHLLRDSSVFRSIMYSPGQAALIAIPSAKGKHYAEDALGPAAGEFERAGHTATEVAAHSTMVVVGGFGTTGAALDTITELGSCGGTVTTDLTDYHPGQTVIMSGSGWTPGEQITLNLHRDSNEPPDTVLYATADENGDWINSDYLVQDFDIGVVFVLTATGDSGCSAQTTFTDATSLKGLAVGAQVLNPVTSGNSATYAITVSFSGGGSCNVPLTITAPTPQTGLPAGTSAVFGPPSSVTGTSTSDIPTTLTISTTLGTTPAGTYTFTVHAAQGTGCGNGGNDFDVAAQLVVVSGVSPTTTTLTSSLNPSTFGDNVTLTATVHAGAPLVTTGSVTFIEGGTCASPTTTLAGPTALNGSGQAAFSSTTLSVGSHTIVACYGGAAGFAASSGNVVQVVRAVTTTALVSSLNPSTFGDSVTFTATVHAGVPLVTTGSVTFIEGGTCAAPLATLAGPTALNGSGQAAFSSTTLSVGSHTIVACYGGATGFGPSNGNVVQVVNAATTTTLASSLNPSTFGDNVTFTATVHAGVPLVTTGSITFIEGGTCALPTTVLAGPTALNGSGQAAFSTTTLSVASHTIVACYGGATGFAASSGNVIQVVNAATTTTLASSLNPSTFGDNVTFTATVHSGVPLVTTGSVTFIEGGTCAAPLATLAGPTALNGSGQAAFSSTTLSVGSHTIVACYGGATGFAASSGNVVQVVNAATTTTLDSSLNPSTFGDNVTFTATVHAGIPLVTTGSITFIEGGTCASPTTTLAGPTALNPSGQAAFSTATLTAATHTIIACYGGAAGFAASSGNVAQVVKKADVTIVVTPYNVTYDTNAHTATGTATGLAGLDLSSGLDLSGTTHTAAGDYPTDAWTFTSPNPNYNDTSGTTHDHIDKANANIVITPYNVTYDTNAHTATGTATGLASLDLSSGLNLTGTTHTAAGDYPTDAWTFTSPNPNYNDTSGTTHDHIDKANANIVITPYNVTYDTNAHTATGTATGLASLDLSSGLNLTGTTHTAAGDYPTDAWTFTSPNPNYNDTSGTTHDHIDKANANIVITPYNVTYDTNAHTATGTATGLASLDLSSGLNLTGTTHTAAGDYPTDAWTFTSPNPNYNDTSGTTHDHIDKANANIVITPYNVTYDTNAHTATGTATGLASLDLSSGLNLTGTTHTAAGDYPTDAWTFTSPNPNYNDTSGTTHDHIDKANANIVITPYNVTYDTNAHTATGTATGLAGLDLSSGLDLSGTTHTAAGDYPTDAWTFTSPNPNYNDTSGTTHDHIDKANANIVITPYNVVYDTSSHTATGTATGLASLNLSSGLNLTGTTHTDAGDYPSDAWTFTSPNANYNDASGTTHDHIDKANANIVITPYSVIYDGNPHTATGTATGLGSLNLSSGLNLTGTTHTSAGDYPSDAWTFTSPNPNYNDASGTTHDHIDKANANISVTGYTVTYDGNPHTATGSATGVKGEALAGLVLTGTTHTNAGDFPADPWTFTDVTGNYYNASGSVHDHINKATATIVVTGYTVTYDGNPHTATGSATGAQGEALAGLNLTGTTHTNAGDYPVDPWTFVDVTGNYYNANGTVHDHINKANATIVVTPYHVTYDTFPHTATGSATGAKGEALAGLNLSGTTHTNSGSYTDSWTFTDVTGNYYNASGQITDVIDPRDALVRYIGQQTFVTSGSSSTTAQVTLSASVQDPTGVALVGAKVDFIDTSTGQVMAGGVPVSPVANSPANTGTANKIVTLSTGQFGAQSYLILVRMSGNYDNTDQVMADKTAGVVVMKPAVTNTTTGGGTYAAMGTAAGTYAGGGSGMPTFSVGMAYNKSGTNPKGQIIVTVPQAGGVLYIKSNSISSMAVTGHNSTIYTKSTVYEVLNNGTTVSIDGGVSLRLDTVDGSPDQVGVTVLSSSSVLYYSNNWTVFNNAWRTGPESLSTGSVSVQ